MDKYLFKSLLLLLCCLSGGITRAQPGFQKLYDFGHTTDYTSSSFTASYADSDRIIGSGLTANEDYDSAGNKRDVTFIAAVDYSGNVQWEKKLLFTDSRFRVNRPFKRYNLTKLINGTFVLGINGFEINNSGSAQVFPFVYWFNNNGDSIGFASVPTSDSVYNIITCVNSDAEGNVYTSGQHFNSYTMSDTAGIWLAKFSSSGQFLWKKIIADTPFIDAYSFSNKIIAGNVPHEYLIAGLAFQSDTIRYGLDAIWKFDSAGNVLWRKHIPKLYDWPTNFYNEVYENFDIVKANSGSGYYFATVAPKKVTNGVIEFRGVYYCGKLDEDGNIIWAKTYERGDGYEDGPSGLLQKSNGDLLIHGGTFNTSTERGASTLLLLDSMGNVKWYKAYQYANNCDYQPQQILYSLNVSPNGGIVRGGGLGQDNAQACWDSVGTYSLLVYTDSLGRLNPNDTATISITAYPAQYGPVGIEEPAYSSKNDLMYPNPMHNVLNINWQEDGKAKLVITDIAGKVLMKATIAKGYQQIDMSRLNAGFYIASIRVNNKIRYLQKIAKF